MFKIETIGTIDRGIDGKDSYILVCDAEGGKITKEEVLGFFQKYKYESRYPGDWFCDMITFVWEQYCEDYSAIVGIHHRMDV